VRLGNMEMCPISRILKLSTISYRANQAIGWINSASGSTELPFCQPAT